MAIADYGRSGTRSKWTFVTVALDDGSDETGDWQRAKEEANASAAAADPSVIAYIGPYNSGAAMVSMPVLNKAGVPQLLPSATWPGLVSEGWGEGEPARFRPSGRVTAFMGMPSDAEQPVLAADWGKALGAKSAYIVSDSSGYSKGMAAAFMARAQANGMSLSGSSSFSANDPDTRQLTSAPASSMIFLAPSSVLELGELLKAWGEAKVRAEVIATDVALSDQFLALTGVEADGWHIVSNSSADFASSLAGRKFVDEFRQQFASVPGQYAANAYDLTTLVLQAATKVGPNRPALVGEISATAGYQGASGEVTFGTNGQRITGSIRRYTVANGSFVPEPEQTVSAP